jgi:nitrogen fixation NifU-like protein
VKYSDRTIAYYEKMKNTGGFDEDLPNVGTGIVGSPLCGDVMKLQLFFSDDDVIVDAKYKVFGCVSAIASMELATTLLRGRTINEAREIKNEDVAQSLELSEIKRHCSVLAKESIDAAIEDYISKRDKVDRVITITDQAVSRITELLTEHGGVGLLISIGCGSGCSSSIDYAISYVTDVDGSMVTAEASGIKFFYAPEIELMIRGLNIDVVGDGDEGGFVITNKYHRPCQNCSCRCGGVQ